MGWFNEYRDDYRQVHNEGNLTHDLLAGAVSYEAAKAYEDHCAREGRPDNHAKSKELLAGFAGAAAMRLGETKGRDLWDEYKADRVQERAQQQLYQGYDARYDNQYDRYDTDQYCRSDAQYGDRYTRPGTEYADPYCRSDVQYGDRYRETQYIDRYSQRDPCYDTSY